MDLDHLVFDVGHRVVGRGLLRQVDGEMWFDPPHGVSRAGGVGRPRLSRYAIRLEDVDASAVAEAGPAGGWVTVTGVWLGDAIRAERWAPSPNPPKSMEPIWRQPPCPPPADGWPEEPAEHDYAGNLKFDLGELEETGAAVTVVLFRPGPAQTVLVVAATDEAAVERQLRPQLGARLCVVPSRWTTAQIEQVRAVIEERRDEWTVDVVGDTSSQVAQRVIHVRLVRVLPTMARWAAGVPEGLLELTTVLTPAS